MTLQDFVEQLISLPKEEKQGFIRENLFSFSSEEMKILNKATTLALERKRSKSN